MDLWGDRSDQSLKQLIHKIDNNSCIFVTDEWEGFFRCLPEKRHFFGKDLTVLIEQNQRPKAVIFGIDWRDSKGNPKPPAAASTWFTVL